jgi:hypothetical protein
MNFPKTAAAVAATFISGFCLYAQDLKTPVGYMDNLSKEFSNIKEDTWSYTSGVAHGKSARKIEKRRKEVVSSITTAINKAKRMPGFDGDNALRDSTISYLEVSKAVINNDYEKIVNMEEVAEQSYDLMEAYMLAQEKANEKLNAAVDMINAEEKKFAANHGVNLLESKDKTSKKLEQASKVYKYYNPVYLIFFKSYKQEAYLMDAMSKNDVNAIEQNKNALAKTSAEGLASMKDIKPFEGDGSIKSACEQMLNFYKDEAEKKLKDAGSFYVKKDNFDKIKKEFESKSQSSRTQQDVDKYNKAVNDYNQASNDFNNTNANLNANRSKLLDNWNKSVANFTDNHIAK